jgi:hypothetical protein
MIDLSSMDPAKADALCRAIDELFALPAPDSMYMSMETYDRLYRIEHAPRWRKLWWRVKWAIPDLIDRIRGRA